MKTTPLLALPLVTFALSCASPPPPASPARATAPASAAAASTAVATPPPAAPNAIPDTPAGHQLAWVLDAVNGGPTPTEGSLTTHFTPDFLAEVPPAQGVAILASLAKQVGPVSVVRFEPAPSPNALVAVVESRVGHLRIKLAVEDAPSHRMAALLFQPAADLDPVPASWGEVESKVRAVAPEASFLAATLGPSGCTKIDGVAEDKARPLGSGFKLYVLAALAKQIAAGTHKWTDILLIDDAKKSLPSGKMQDEMAGKAFFVSDYAKNMISISDNTAADHLLFFVGREAVEAEVKASGHADPSRLVPFLSTREMFGLKMSLSPDEQRAYLAADVAGKRRMLAALDKRPLPPLSAAETWKAPRFIDEMEWLASPNDVCKLAVDLKTLADAPKTAKVAEILSVNPGIPDASGAYEYIGFKGGSEPGVMSLSWILKRKSDGAWLFLGVEYADPNAPIDEAKGVAAAQAARAFLATQK